MSDPLGGAAAGSAYLPVARTSRWAIVSAVSSFLCVFPGTGVVGLVFALIGLREIGSSHGHVAGSNLAWVGLCGGLVSSLGWAAVAQHYVQVSHAIDAPTAAFLTAWSRSEADGEAAAAPGLRPVMRAGDAGEIVQKALRERLGEFSGLGPRTHFRYRPHLGADEISATYQLRFKNGAPCAATFAYARSGGHVEVVGVTLESPVLRDLMRAHRNALLGAATPDVRDFGTPADHAPPAVQSFSP